MTLLSARVPGVTKPCWSAVQRRKSYGKSPGQEALGVHAIRPVPGGQWHRPDIQRIQLEVIKIPVPAPSFTVNSTSCPLNSLCTPPKKEICSETAEEPYWDTNRIDPKLCELVQQLIVVVLFQVAPHSLRSYSSISCSYALPPLVTQVPPVFISAFLRFLRFRCLVQHGDRPHVVVEPWLTSHPAGTQLIIPGRLGS